MKAPGQTWTEYYEQKEREELEQETIALFRMLIECTGWTEEEAETWLSEQFERDVN